MRALTLVADRKIEILDVPEPPAPGDGEVQLRIKAIGLNHLDVWGWRGMAFAKRKLPLIVGVEAAGEIAAVGAGVTAFRAGDRGGRLRRPHLRHLPGLPEGRDNLCENVVGRDGFPRRRLRARPRQHAGAAGRAGAGRHELSSTLTCAPIAFGTVQHMLFDNAKLESGESILVQAGGSGIGTAAPSRWRRASARRVVTAVGSDEKIPKASTRRRSGHQLPHRPP